MILPTKRHIDSIIREAKLQEINTYDCDYALAGYDSWLDLAFTQRFKISGIINSVTLDQEKINYLICDFNFLEYFNQIQATYLFLTEEHRKDGANFTVNLCGRDIKFIQKSLDNLIIFTDGYRFHIPLRFVNKEI